MRTRSIFLFTILGMLMLALPATAAPKKGTFTVGDKTTRFISTNSSF